MHWQRKQTRGIAVHRHSAQSRKRFQRVHDAMIPVQVKQVARRKEPERLNPSPGMNPLPLIGMVRAESEPLLEARKRTIAQRRPRLRKHSLVWLYTQYCFLCTS